MEKGKKIKLYIGLFYLLFIGVFLYYFFSKFSFQEITSYDFIKNNRDYFFELRQSNLFLLATLFFLFTIIWVLAAGFGSPIASPNDCTLKSNNRSNFAICNFKLFLKPNH